LIFDFISLEVIYSEATYGALRINTGNCDTVHTNCTVASFFVMFCCVFFPWTIASFVSVIFCYVCDTAYFKNISLITLKT